MMAHDRKPREALRLGGAESVGKPARRQGCRPRLPIVGLMR